MAEKTIATPENQNRTSTTEDTRNREQYIIPPVDIYETPDDLRLCIDAALRRHCTMKRTASRIKT
jgi:hypothetical protein